MQHLIHGVTTQSEEHALARTVLLGRPTLNPCRGLHVVVVFEFGECTKSLLGEEMLEREEVAVPSPVWCTCQHSVGAGGNELTLKTRQ